MDESPRHSPRQSEIGSLTRAAANLNLAGGGDFGGIDFSKLGGGAGLPTGDEEEEEEESDDEDMPGLEGEDDEKHAGAEKASA